MPIIEFCTFIQAPAERCFDLARDIDLHIASTPGTREKAVGGVTSGLIDLGEEVTWEATHFGVRQRLTSRITSFDRPRHFRDSQVRGAFRRFDHDHFFKVESGSTVMRDVFDYESPFASAYRVSSGRRHSTRNRIAPSRQQLNCCTCPFSKGHSRPNV